MKPFIPTCLVCGSNKEVYPAGNDLLFCDQCGTTFFPMEGGAYTWDCDTDTTVMWRFYMTPTELHPVPLDHLQCPIDKCQMCGKLIPDKHLSYYTNQETNEVTLVVCDECNMIDPKGNREQHEGE